MPQMGESIAEGTIVRWIKKVGDAVDRDEPLFEISTDKVDAEIPSPAAGILTEIKVKEGETVAVDSVVAMIAAEGEAIQSAPVAPAASPDPAPAKQQGDGSPASVHTDKPSGQARPNGSNGHQVVPVSPDERRQKSSPLVRKIAKENQVDISQIAGTGIGGRVTKHDILGFMENPKAQIPDPKSQREGGGSGAPASARPPATTHGERVEIEPLSIMRRKIAEHMVLSKRTSAHVHTVFHVNFSTVERIRQQKKAEYERHGTKLTYMAFIAKAVIDALHRQPLLNASFDGDNVIHHKDVSLGIAVSLEGNGLIVPVIKNADERNLLGLSRAIADVAERARAKQLKPEEVHGGTFTITNPGQLGAQFGMPIINQPQVAILGVGTVEKRPVVVDDAIAIRTMAYLTLGFDHRLVDGATADQFMADIKNQIENFDPNQV